ncbi:MAG: preprotein translocase subunit SecY [Candidatus Liptonbacteria bacterium]|nr:preprotein translocase subunit SecY [Candidatus Liptonbacteria bacterium]
MERFLNIIRIPDLRKKILIVMGLLMAFRFLAAIPIPSVDATRLQELLASNNLLGLLNIFSGGGLSNLSIAMLGVGPYITATIVMQLLTVIFPHLKKIYYEEGTIGRAKFNRLSRFLTVPFAILQSYSFLTLLTSQGVLNPLGASDIIRNVVVITAGSLVVMWIGELISEQKVGNGISLLIFGGIVSGIPQFVARTAASYTPAMLPTILAFLAVSVAVIAGVVFINQGERKISVSYARRVRGTKLFGGVASYLPLRVNQAGVIPIIFAISILLFPQFFGQIVSLASVNASIVVNKVVSSFIGNQLLYGVAYFTLVVVFTYFYTAIMFDPKEISKNLQQSGGFVPGIRPGEPTRIFLGYILNRITLFGALFLGVVAILPNITSAVTGVRTMTIGGTALLIVVAVAIEIIQQIDSQLAVREYEGI